MRLPRKVSEFQSSWPSFKNFLESHGSEILSPTNDYEVARFTTPHGVGIVYRNKHGNISSWIFGAGEAWVAYKEGHPWRVKDKLKRIRGNDDLERVTARDGKNCIFCGRGLTEHEATLEHFVPLIQGGTNNIHNLGRACESCNTAVGHKPVAEKIKFAVAMQKDQT